MKTNKKIYQDYPITKREGRPSSPFLLTYYHSGQRIRKAFATYDEASKHYDNYLDSLNKSQNALWSRNLSFTQVADIDRALNILPKGVSIAEAVEYYVGVASKATPLPKAVKAFLETKANTVSPSIYNSYELRLKKFLEQFDSWESVSADSLRSWLIKRGAPKTIQHFFVLIKGLFKFAIRRNYIRVNICDALHHTDFPKVIKKQAEYLSVEDATLFLRFIEKKYPQYTSWCALAFFAGIRREEINRMDSSMIDIKNKRIDLCAQIVKTNSSWTLEGFPDILWAWLEKYGAEISPLVFTRWDGIIAALKREYPQFKWVKNASRHSFATYHLALLRNASLTQHLMHHQSGSNQLWDSYLGGLPPKENAERYFSIAPKN